MITRLLLALSAAVLLPAAPAIAGGDCASCHGGYRGGGAPVSALGTTPAEDYLPATANTARAATSIVSVVYVGYNHAVGVTQGSTVRTVGVGHNSVEAVSLWAPDGFMVPAGSRSSPDLRASRPAAAPPIRPLT